MENWWNLKQMVFWFPPFHTPQSPHTSWVHTHTNYSLENHLVKANHRFHKFGHFSRSAGFSSWVNWTFGSIWFGVTHTMSLWKSERSLCNLVSQDCRGHPSLGVDLLAIKLKHCSVSSFERCDLQPRLFRFWNSEEVEILKDLRSFSYSFPQKIS